MKGKSKISPNWLRQLLLSAKRYGARPLKRVIQNEVQNVLAMKILNGEIKEGDEVTVDVTCSEGRLLDVKVKN